jgi:hypothetical protein
MKTSALVKALLLASLPFASQSFASEPVIYHGSVSTVTLALTISTTVDGLIAKDDTGKAISPKTTDDDQSYTVGTTHTRELGTKIQVAKYSTKEFLQDLLNSGALGEETSIAGWTVQKVQTTTGSGLGLAPGPVKFYLYKKVGNAAAQVIALNGKIALDLAAKVQADSIKAVTKGEAAPVITYMGTLKQVGQLNIDINGEVNKHFVLHGSYTGTQKLMFLGSVEKTPIILSGAAKLNDLTGQLSPETVVEGGFTIAPGKAVADLSAYANVNVDDDELMP